MNEIEKFIEREKRKINQKQMSRKSNRKQYNRINLKQRFLNIYKLKEMNFNQIF